MAIIVPLRHHINLDPMNLDSFIESKLDEITNRIKTLIIQTSRSNNDYSTSLQIELLETHLKFLRRECDCIVCLLCEDELYDPIMNIINEQVAQHNEEVKVRQREEEAATKIQSVFRGNAIRDRFTKAYILAAFQDAENALKDPNATEEKVQWAEDMMFKIRQFMDDAKDTRAGCWLLGKESVRPEPEQEPDWWQKAVQEHPELSLEWSDSLNY